jgi:hypothetical protein
VAQGPDHPFKETEPFFRLMVYVKVSGNSAHAVYQRKSSLDAVKVIKKRCSS